MGTPCGITLQNVAAEVGVSMKILEQECNDQILLKLANFCVEWKLVGRHLKLTHAEITEVDGDNCREKLKRVGMLEKWKQKFAFNATYRVLVEALLALNNTSDALKCCIEIKSHFQ